MSGRGRAAGRRRPLAHRLTVTIPLLAVGLVAVFCGAVMFTNAVEWAGNRLGLGVGAAGALLAGVSTALPESVIPIVAILRGDPASEDVAIGAIIGAPFMLATIAMAVVGVTAVAYRRRREQGRSLRLHRRTLRRDLSFFLLLLTAAIAVGLGAPTSIRVPVAVGLVVAYLGYVVLTVTEAVRSRPTTSCLRSLPIPRRTIHPRPG